MYNQSTLASQAIVLPVRGRARLVRVKSRQTEAEQIRSMRIQLPPAEAIIAPVWARRGRTFPTEASGCCVQLNGLCAHLAELRRCRALARERVQPGLDLDMYLPEEGTLSTAL